MVRDEHRALSVETCCAVKTPPCLWSLVKQSVVTERYHQADTRAAPISQLNASLNRQALRDLHFRRSGIDSQQLPKVQRSVLLSKSCHLRNLRLNVRRRQLVCTEKGDRINGTSLQKCHKQHRSDQDKAFDSNIRLDESNLNSTEIHQSLRSIRTLRSSYPLLSERDLTRRSIAKRITAEGERLVDGFQRN
jgi:hypothetical protein